MTEKNMILNHERNRASLLPPMKKESNNPLLRFLQRQLELISDFISKWATP
jgi:hypothetical protein